MSDAIRKPKKGAGRKWASRLEELGKRKPPEDLVKKINGLRASFLVPHMA